MNAGRLNKRVKIVRLTKSDDGFGGFTSTRAVVDTLWCEKTQKEGEISTENGKRERQLVVELIMRKKAADVVLDTDLLRFEDADDDYRINSRFDNVNDFYTKITATKVV